MIGDLSALPVEFWVACVALVGSFIFFLRHLRTGLAIPGGAVLVTVGFWYIFDVIYNDYATRYEVLFAPEILGTAWEQVIVFLIAFTSLSIWLHRALNKQLWRNLSFAYVMFRTGIGNQGLQRGLDILARYSFGVWLLILIGAFFRFQGEFLFYLFPYVGRHPGPWVTSGLGGGADSLLALANYLQLMLGAVFGVTAALSTNRRTRWLSIFAISLIWPYYIFDRTRKFILVIALPGLCAWALLRCRGSLLKKGVLLAGFAIVVNAWFGFIISNRLDSSVTNALFAGNFEFSKASKEEHQGLNMFEELAWITKLTQEQSFDPGLGENYLANLANPIPRVLWPDKPMIGIDYAIARGLGGAPTAVGVYATLSNGMIGQGVVNFGLYVGPFAAALIMALWCVWLARLDLLGDRIGFTPLFGLGLILTFTMGRDITFLEMYPFVFGYFISRYLQSREVRRRRAWSSVR